MAPLPTLFALLCSVAMLLVFCDGKIFTDANDKDLYKERQRPAKRGNVVLLAVFPFIAVPLWLF
uniref:Transmembrane protein n=1 Tax=Globodera pallida TaxID=36090 RepID=A0A183CSC2_GLOPA